MNFDIKFWIFKAMKPGRMRFIKLLTIDHLFLFLIFSLSLRWTTRLLSPGRENTSLPPYGVGTLRGVSTMPEKQSFVISSTLRVDEWSLFKEILHRWKSGKIAHQSSQTSAPALRPQFISVGFHLLATIKWMQSMPTAWSFLVFAWWVNS